MGKPQGHDDELADGEQNNAMGVEFVPVDGQRFTFDRTVSQFDKPHLTDGTNRFTGGLDNFTIQFCLGHDNSSVLEGNKKRKQPNDAYGVRTRGLSVVNVNW
jgi:hypothetical protein